VTQERHPHRRPFWRIPIRFLGSVRIALRRELEGRTMTRARFARGACAALFAAAITWVFAASALAADAAPELPAPLTLPSGLPDQSEPGGAPALTPGSVLPQLAVPAPPGPDAGGSPPAALSRAGGAGRTDGDQNPCGEAAEPARDGGAPFDANCPITPSDDGGADAPFCIDVGPGASCSVAGAVTTTTVASGDGNNDGGDGSGGNHDGGSAPTPGDRDGSGKGVAAVLSPVTTTRGAGGTLPLTGGEIVGLLTIGTALAATGGALARVARRRT
jgi:hypothetical protein